jgi:ankyrin repeat protein
MKLENFDFTEENFLSQINRWIEGGASVNATHPQSGWSLLHLAAEFQHVEAIELLIKNGCNSNLKDIYGQIPLDLAIDSELDGTAQTGCPLDFKCTKKLLELGAGSSLKDDEGDTPLDVVDKYGANARARFDEVIGRRNQ